MCRFEWHVTSGDSYVRGSCQSKIQQLEGTSRSETQIQEEQILLVWKVSHFFNEEEDRQLPLRKKSKLRAIK